MVYHGHVKNGIIVLSESVRLPEGAEVRVDVVRPAEPVGNGQPVPTLNERMKAYIGKVADLPPDASVNHDHYLYGSPKRQ